MPKFVKTYFVVDVNDYLALSGNLPPAEFLPKTSPESITLLNSEKEVPDLWFRADTISDLDWFRQQFDAVPYQFGSDRDHLSKHLPT